MVSKSKQLFTIAGMFFLFFLSVLPYTLQAVFAQHEGHQMQEKSQAPPAKKTSAKPLYYCPMHPSYTSDRPGDCPICNMKLVLKEEAKEDLKTDSPLITKREITPAKEKNLQEVCVEHSCTMEGCPMHVRVNIKPGERLMCPVCGEVISTASGKVVEIGKAPLKTARQVMITAKKQQLIGVKTEEVKRMPLSKTIRAAGKIAYDPELAIAQEEFIQAIKNEDNLKDSSLIERAKSLTEASRRKLKLLGMSEAQIAMLKEKKSAQTSLTLPEKGENVWAYLSVYEYEIGLIKTGLLVEIEAIAYPGEVFKAEVSAISPVLDAASRTNQVRVEIKESAGKLKPEMFVNASIKVDLGSKIAVRDSSVLDTGLRKIVYLSLEDDTLEAREVRLGQKVEDYYEVVDGLEEGDVVVTSGNFLIDSESKLKSALEDVDHKH